MNLRDYLEKNSGKELGVGGHRGQWSEETRENTITCFETLKGKGLSHIEIDLQLTKDDEIVIYHDYDLAGRSPLTGKIRDYTVAQLKDAFEINTLEECVIWCMKNDLPPALEIKCDLYTMTDTMPILTRRLADILNKHRFEDFGYAFALNYKVLWELKQLAPKVMTGLIIAHVPRDPVALMEEMEATIYLSYIDNLNRETVDTLHKAGYFVDGSIVNGENRLRVALELGVDLIEADEPLQTLDCYRRIRRDQ